MRYVLAIGIETEIYKNPSLDVFLNDRFLGTTELDESVPADIQEHIKGDILDAWDFRPYSNPERKYKITLPKKWIIYELDDSTFTKNNTLDIVPKNLQTNTMNGFVTKRDKCKIFNVMLLPKEWFSVDGVKKIFSHCDGRNVVIDFDHGRGWPSVILTSSETESIGTSEHLPIYNRPESYCIKYDEILELYTIENSPESSEAVYFVSSHIKIKEYYERAEKYADINVMMSKDIHACHPQKLFENNDDTTLLHINNDVKLQLEQIATKYQHNED